MRFCTLILFAIIASMPAFSADQPSFERDVLPILQENCQSCHRAAGANLSGMIAPMSFMNYQEVRPWSKAIAKAVANRQMPPWHASKATHGVFKNERTLTDEEIETVVNWAKTGARRGDPADAPAPKSFETLGWQLAGKLGEPDLVLQMPEPYFVADDIQDIQPSIKIELTEEQVPETKWVRAIEYRPGSEVVHHIVGFASKKGEEGELDQRSNFGQIASGTDPQSYDDGYGLPLYPGSTIGLSMHYHKEAGPGTGVWDQSEVAVWFHDKPVVHPLESSTIAHGGFEIPPNQSAWKVIGARTWDEPFRVLEFLPHMHLRGTAAKYTAFYPNGTEEVLLDVPEWNYTWQMAYEYADYKDMPAGTRIEFEIVYNNSPELAAERNFNSNRSVRFGGPTTDEMDLGWLTWCYQEEGKMPETSERFSDSESEESTESTD
jgi:hypothetical protein